MEATTIDQLVHDVLEEIFSLLNGSDLKNCALVCKDWNEVIASSAVTMNKLKTGFRLDRDHISIGCELWGQRKRWHCSDESFRIHQNLEVWIRDGSLMQLPSLDRYNISQVKTLNLHLMSLRTELSKVLELLSRMPLLQMLTIGSSAYYTIETSNAPVAHFKKLTQLKVISLIPQPINKIFEFIKFDNVTELTYRDFARHSGAKIDAVADFIRSKKSLSKLNVLAGVFTQMHQRHDFSGMNLESLIVYACPTLVLSDIQKENIRKSLVFNAHSLTSLSLPSKLMSKEVLVVIFNCLRKLTTLDIDSASDGDVSWIDNLSPNDISRNLSLKTLKVERVGAIIGLKAILQGAPQLKKLTLGDVTDAIMKEVATSAPRLLELRINFLKEVLTGDQRFNELKSLTINVIAYNVYCLPSLLARCPKIKTFECRYYRNGNLNSSIIDMLRRLNTLKNLRLMNFTPEVRRIIFDKLKVNYENLRSLELRSVVGKFILFDFPENPEEWNIEEQEARFSDFQAANPDA